MSKETKKRSPKSKGNKKYDKRDTSDRSRFKKEELKSEGYGHSEDCNDPSWYIPDPQILKDVASYPFSDRLGIPIDYDAYRPSTDYNKDNPLRIPGICKISLIPNVGSQDATNAASSPVNLAGRSLYQAVRHLNSGATNYDWNDMMMYMIAMDQAYMTWSWLVRAYGVAVQYSYRNSYYPHTLLYAMGFKRPQTFTSSLAQIRAKINTMALKLNSFPVPSVFAYFTRHMWLYQNMFVDSLTSKAQTYFYNPAALYVYDESVAPAELKPIPATVDGTDDQSFLDNLQKLIDSVCDPLMQSQDIDIIGGDILKAYGRENMFAITMIPENYLTPILYSEEVLRQIHNLTIVPILTSSTKIFQNGTNGNLIQNFTTSVPSDTQAKDVGHEWLINFDLDSVAPEDVIVGTRLTAVWKPDGTIAAGSEIVTGVTVYDDPWDLTSETLPSETSFYSIYHFVSNTNYSYLFDFAKRLSYASNFRYFPLQYTDTAAGNSSTKTNGRVVHGDLNNYTVLDYHELDRMHQAAFAGLFGVPYTLYSAGGRK